MESKQKSRLGAASNKITEGGEAGGGGGQRERGGGTSTSLWLTNPRPLSCFGSLDNQFFSLRGRFIDLRNIEIKY